MVLISYICGIVLVELNYYRFCESFIYQQTVGLKPTRKKKKEKNTYSGGQKALLKVQIYVLKMNPYSGVSTRR